MVRCHARGTKCYAHLDLNMAFMREAVIEQNEQHPQHYITNRAGTSVHLKKDTQRVIESQT